MSRISLHATEVLQRMLPFTRNGFNQIDLLRNEYRGEMLG